MAVLVFRFGTGTLASIFTYAGIANTCDGLNSTSPASLK